MGSGKSTGSGNFGFYSKLYLVPKKNGKLCPIIDLSILNQYLNKQPFKMETVKLVCISFNNINSFCPGQDTSISVQNSSYSPSLAPTTVVLRGTTTASFSTSWSSTLSKTTDTSKRKVSTSKPPIA